MSAMSIGPAVSEITRNKCGLRTDRQKNKCDFRYQLRKYIIFLKYGIFLLITNRHYNFIIQISSVWFKHKMNLQSRSLNLNCSLHSSIKHINWLQQMWMYSIAMYEHKKQQPVGPLTVCRMRAPLPLAYINGKQGCLLVSRQTFPEYSKVGGKLISFHRYKQCSKFNDKMFRQNNNDFD